MGQNMTNKIFDKQKLNNEKKAKALLTHYQIDKKYGGGNNTKETEKRIATFMKVVFGKGGVIRLLADSEKTKTDSYFAVLADHVRAAYTKCKYGTYISSKNKEVTDRLTANLAQLDEWCKSFENNYEEDPEKWSDEDVVTAIREAKKELVELRARDWLLWKPLRGLGYISLFGIFFL